MKASQIVGLPVITMKDGTKQGLVVDAIVDPEKLVVSHYLVKKDSKYDLLLVEAPVVAGVGQDFMVVSDSTDIRRIFGDPKRMEIVSRGFFLPESNAVSSTGASLGKVTDFDFTPQNGAVVSLTLEDGRDFPVAKILALSGTTVFVRTGMEEVPRPKSPAASVQRSAPKDAPAPIAPVAQRSYSKRQVKLPEPVAPKPAAASSAPEPKRPASTSAAQMAYQNTPSPDVPDFSNVNKTPSANNGLRNYFRKMLIGKKMSQDVSSEDGIFSIAEGDTITEWTVQLAEQHDAVQLLMKYVEPA